jgi:tetratricopeptide (TPR) repeat protein
VNVPALEPPDLHLVRAAAGWLELHLPAEAEAELAQVSPQLQEHPAVLDTYWQLHAARCQWNLAHQCGERLVAAAPQLVSGWIHRAYAARRMAGGGLASAWDALLPAAELFPDESLIPYNLACYACQLGQLPLARQWLQRALAIATRLQHHAALLQMAAQDADLAPLHEEVSCWPQS